MPDLTLRETHTCNHQRGRSCDLECRHLQGFTLVELLVVVGVIAILLAILVPAVSRALDRARAIQCQSNLRYLIIAFKAYEVDYRGRRPPNLQGVQQFWFDTNRVGAYLTGSFGKGGVFSCPSDANARRSYSMNIWTSCWTDIVSMTDIDARFWGSSGNSSDRVILLIESWSSQNNMTQGYESSPTVGFHAATPGRSFGADGGLSPLLGAARFGPVNSEIDYSRHRTYQPAGGLTMPDGVTHIAFLDGHVAPKRHDELANFTTGRSQLVALWSPLDISNN